MKYILLAVVILAAAFGFGWLATTNDLAMMRFFAPKYEQVRRDTFEQSKAYNQGMIQELQNMQFEYVKASPEHKAALRSIILHRSADYTDNLPSDLRSFITDLKNSR
jgi:hypothetical protein